MDVIDLGVAPDGWAVRAAAPAGWRLRFSLTMIAFAPDHMLRRVLAHLWPLLAGRADPEFILVHNKPDAPDEGGMAAAIRRDGGQCRLFGVYYGFVASGAALPTSSQINPTVTIVALAIRLADHLKRLACAEPAIDLRMRRAARAALEPV